MDTREWTSFYIFCEAAVVDPAHIERLTQLALRTKIPKFINMPVLKPRSEEFTRYVKLVETKLKGRADDLDQAIDEMVNGTGDEVWLGKLLRDTLYMCRRVQAQRNRCKFPQK